MDSQRPFESELGLQDAGKLARRVEETVNPLIPHTYARLYETLRQFTISVEPQGERADQEFVQDRGV